MHKKSSVPLSLDVDCIRFQRVLMRHRKGRFVAVNLVPDPVVFPFNSEQNFREPRARNVAVKSQVDMQFRLTQQSKRKLQIRK